MKKYIVTLAIELDDEEAEEFGAPIQEWDFESLIGFEDSTCEVVSVVEQT